MKRQLNAIVLLSLLGISLGVAQQAFSVPSYYSTITLAQDNGYTFQAIQRGDEYAHWLETVEGYSIVESAGQWYYAVLDEDRQLVPSAVLVGAPVRSQALQPHLRPDPTEERVTRPPRFINTARALRSTTTQQLLVILVDFNNVSFSYSDASFQSVVFDATNSVKEYYSDNAYNQFDIVPASEIYGTNNDGIVHVNHPGAHPNFGSTFSAGRTLFEEVLTLADPFVDFDDFDTNFDNYVSPEELSIILVVAGYEAAFTGAPANNIWAHQSNLFSAKTLDSVDLSYYAMFGEIHSDEAEEGGTYSEQATIGVICHELGHLMLGLPDLYDTDETSKGIGRWSGMAGGAWGQLTHPGDSPSHLDAWSRTAVGFASPIVIDTMLTGDTLAPVATLDDIRMLNADRFQSPLSEEFFYLENRQQHGYDASLPGEGLLIYHVDESVATNTDEFRKHVDVEAADGFNDMDDADNENGGDDGDPFPGVTNNTQFSPLSNPNTNTNDGIATDIRITQITQTEDTISFNFMPGGATLFDDDLSYSIKSFGFNDASKKSDWTALEHTNTSTFDELHGFEIYTRGTATIDFYWYESMVGNVPTTLLDTQIGMGTNQGWNRIILNDPSHFP